MAVNTDNFGFKKPDESDFYDVQDQNNNWDIADQELEKLNSPTFEDYTEDTSVPEAVTAIEALKSKSKIGMLLSNIKAAFKGACLIGHIVNNCVTDNPNLPLSAAQGKALQDQLATLNSNLISSYEKLNDIVLMKCGNIVIIDIAILKATLPGGWTKLFDIPSGYLPLPDIKNVDMYYIASMYVKGSDISKRIRVTNNVVYGYSDTSISGELYGMIVYVCG